MSHRASRHTHPLALLLLAALPLAACDGGHAPTPKERTLSDLPDVRVKLALFLTTEAQPQASGKVQVPAQHGEMELSDEKGLLLTSLQNKVVIAAKEEILRTAGSYARADYFNALNGDTQENQA